jgi:nucleobase:cation symporter-1, NCS1 family
MSTGVAEPQAQQPASDRVWSIETNGINPIPDAERHGRPLELFWVWCAANISILAIAFYGAAVVAFYGLNVWQGILVGLAGTVASFALVGLIAISGKWSGAPTLVLSRASFGVLGNGIPTAISYLSLVGWEIILVALSALATETVIDRLGGPTGIGTRLVAFLIIAAVTIGVGLLGHATIVRIQTWFTWAFAALTVVFVALTIPEIDWAKASALHGAGFLHGVLPALSVVMAGLGIGWVNAAADYSRYLPRNASSRGVFGWTTFGASLGPVLLIVFGVLLAAKHPELASSGNPIGDLAEPLPTWFLVPYLLVAVGGLLAGAVLDIYSSGLNLLTLGVPLPRYLSVGIDGVFMVVGNIYLLFVAQDFIGPFTGFLLVLGVPLAAWSAIFLMDMALYRRREGYDEADLYRSRGRYGAVNWLGVASFVVAVVIGLSLITSTARIFSWVGWWAKSDVFSGSSLGLLVAFVLAGLLYLALNLAPFTAALRPAERSPAGGPAGRSPVGR